MAEVKNSMTKRSSRTQLGKQDLMKPVTQANFKAASSAFEAHLRSVARPEANFDLLMQQAKFTIPTDGKVNLGQYMSCLSKSLALNVLLGEDAYIVSFNGQPVLMLSYIGLIKILVRSGGVKSVRSQVVLKDEYFRWQEGLKPNLEHEPGPGDREDRDQIEYVYAVADMKDGTQVFHVMHISDIESLSKKMKKDSSNIWTKWFGQMAMKTVVRRLVKKMPLNYDLSPEYVRNDEIQIDDSTFDVEAEVIKEDGGEAVPA